MADPTVWKVRQNRINALVGLLGALLTLGELWGYSLDLDDEDILALASGLAVALGVFNLWATTATTTKIGLPSNDPTLVRTRTNDIDRPGNGENSPEP